MSKFKSYLKKGWVFVVAAALIVGSSTSMAALLNSNALSTQAPTVAVIDEPKATIAPTAQPSPSDVTKPAYILIDESGNIKEKREELKKEIANKHGSTAENIDERTDEVIANMTPTAEDMTAEQAADKAAAALTETYNLDLNGWTARASFYKYHGMPYGDVWQFDFTKPEDADKSDHWLAADHYSATMDAITGKLLIANFFSSDAQKYQESSETEKLEDPVWLKTAEKYVAELLNNGVTIVNSRIIDKNKFGGVTIVLELSNETAFGIRMVGDGTNNKIAYAMFFPKGYDGSLDNKGGPVTEDGVG